MAKPKRPVPDSSLSNPVPEDDARFVVEFATAEIHHWDDRKYQFVYLALAALLATLLACVDADWNPGVREWILAGLSSALWLFLIPAIVAIQLYTRSLNIMRSRLFHLFGLVLLKKESHSKWQTEVANAYADWTKKLEALRERHRIVMWFLENLS